MILDINCIFLIDVFPIYKYNKINSGNLSVGFVYYWIMYKGWGDFIYWYLGPDILEIFFSYFNIF